ncbi:MAG: trigger factor [Pseudomonadales bacterium]
MQVTLEESTGLERRLRISIPAEQVENKVDERLKQTAGSVRIKGFRPGKVPLREVRRRFGDEIRQEVSSEVMQGAFSEAIQQEEVAPAGTPRIEDVSMETGKDLEFTAVFEVLPDVTLGDLEEIEVERPVASVTEADVDKMIDTLRDQNLTYHETDRACQEGDKVNIDFKGFIDNEPFEGGESEGADIVIGQGGMIEGFEEGLVGCKSGEEKSFPVTFPEDYQNKELAGKEAVFEVKVNTVSAPEKPDLDEEFFSQFGVERGGVDAFRQEVRQNMEKELQSSIKNRVKNRVMDELLRINEIDVPRGLVDSEIDRMRHDAVQRFGGGNQNIDPSVLPAEMFQQQAERSVALGLLINAIIEQYGLEVDNDRVKGMVEDLASSYEEPEQVVNYYYGNEQQLNQIQNIVLEEQVVDKMLETAHVTDVEMSYEEAIKPPETPAAEGESGDEGTNEMLENDQ